MITFVLVWALRPRLDGTKQSVDLDRPGRFCDFKCSPLEMNPGASCDAIDHTIQAPANKSGHIVTDRGLIE